MAKNRGKWFSDIFISDEDMGDGSTVTYVLSQYPYNTEALWVTLDGLTLTMGTHYTVDLGDKEITFTTAPAIGQQIQIKYIKK